MKVRKKIATPEKLHNQLQATSPLTWILLGVVILSLFGFFIWSLTANITYKLEGNLSVNNGNITINYDEKRKNELEVGQKIIINDIEGEITDISEDGKISISINNLIDGEYKYTIILRTIHPIRYLTNKN